MGEQGTVLMSRNLTVGPARESVAFEFELPALQSACSSVATAWAAAACDAGAWRGRRKLATLAATAVQSDHM